MRCLMVAIVALLSSVGLVACRPSIGSGQYAQVPVCAKWRDSIAVVEAELTSFSAPELYRLRDGYTYPVSRAVLTVADSYKEPHVRGTLDVLVGNGIDATGRSENGNMRNARGVFFLRDVEGALAFSGPAFCRESLPGVFEQNITADEPRTLTRENLRDLPTRCAATESTQP